MFTLQFVNNDANSVGLMMIQLLVVRMWIWEVCSVRRLLISTFGSRRCREKPEIRKLQITISLLSKRKENKFGCKIYVFVSGKTSREQNSDFKYLFYLSVPFHQRQNKTLFSLSRILLNKWKVLLTLVKSFSKLSAIFSGALHWEYAFWKPNFLWISAN